jgi:hypothetical protein
MSGQRLLACTLILAACQSYPFETREAKLSRGRQIKEVVTTVTPADILFVIDNSGSMIDELTELQSNLDAFFDTLVASANDFQVGIIAPDVECNVPGRSCGTAGTSSVSCCNIMGGCAFDTDCDAGQHCNLSNAQCECSDQDLDSDDIPDVTSCDGGRLREWQDGSHTRVFHRPETGSDVELWKSNVRDTITSLGCKGSGYEGTLEAARRAIVCAANPLSEKCPDPAIGHLNAGFLRPEATLVIIFITDEDDCSIMTPIGNTHPGRVPIAYTRPAPFNAPAEQLAKFCSPHECYGYLAPDGDQNGVNDWVQRNSGFEVTACRGESGSSFARTINPPSPSGVTAFLDDIIEAKGGNPAKVRAGAILGAVLDPTKGLGMAASACYKQATGPNTDCGCWANTTVDLFCDVTNVTNSVGTVRPSDTGVDVPDCGDRTFNTAGGCQAMTGGRTVRFLEELAAERLGVEVADLPTATQSADPQVHIDSICKFEYDDSLAQIAATITFDRCVNIGETIVDDETCPDATNCVAAGDLRVVFNNRLLEQVPAQSARDGWSFAELGSEVCLEGRLTKNVDDRFEIFVLEDN